MRLELISQESLAETHRTPLLFVHGMGHGALSATRSPSLSSVEN